MSTATNGENRLRDLFELYSTRVLAYAMRHIGPNQAQDVVADVFFVAWRRLDEAPDAALPWLLVIARNTIANRRRGIARQQRLADELIALERSAATAPGAEDAAVERRTMLAALRELSAAEREALLLVAWDGLPAVEAAVVAGCSRNAFEVRLHRARNRLRRVLADEEPSDPSPARGPLLREYRP
ncbi:MAG TPA: sigma-70 family RNA polymerase sigma factor [Jatrophihabitans sp.]|nr:sigma-70 family RNA polymerase sigma factor [Jatrophihabitans sp.]